ncbi:hypothetical protein [Streptomyces beihaiensis]|uniref:Uncharacterized protein n=1 Tax=Streptomyces beihaiensis TaxID=2984495 RepID=A0ABT3TPY3_9ACTN|nr:hypothetical protein [Streptomyces beihaiensis]MCX3059093.1 hypothetical protein [Streptomyces beihaiensis]
MEHGSGPSRRVHVESDLTETLPAPGATPRKWLFTLDFTEDAAHLLDTTPDDDGLSTAGAIITANITEWWDLKDTEPATAALAVRVN